jgi:hypothetical protein
MQDHDSVSTVRFAAGLKNGGGDVRRKDKILVDPSLQEPDLG